MNVKSTCLAAVVMTLAGLSAARAQGPVATSPPQGASLAPPLFPGTGPTRPTSLTPVGATVDGAMPSGLPHKLSDWILGDRASDCCDQAGGDGPVVLELYTRAGVSIPTDRGYLGRTLKTGWLIQGGGRSLFYNPEGDAAWTIDLSLSNTAHHGRHDDRKAVLRNIIVPSATPDVFGQTGNVRVPRVEVSPRRLNRTFANIGFGREWYLSGSALGCRDDACPDGSCAGTWRMGFDVGGRWGTAKLELNELRHRTDVVGGVWVALHSDMEIPWGCCVLTLGGRVEWDYVWSDILQQQTDADLQNVNLMITLGIKF